MGRTAKRCYGCFETFYPSSPTIKYCGQSCRELVKWEKQEARLLDQGATPETLEAHRKRHPRYRMRQILPTSAQEELRAYASEMQKLREQRIKSREMDDIDLDALIERDNHRCHICGGKVSERRKFGKRGTPRGDMSTYPTVDHIIPVSRGGSHTWGNVKLAHWSCNSKRGAATPP